MLDKPTDQQDDPVIVSRPNFRQAEFRLRGTAPYVGNKMSARSIAKMRSDQEAGQQARSKKKREPKVFEGRHLEAAHVSQDGWFGIPVTAFRTALIDTCRLIGFQMTKAKMTVFVVADGFDRDDGQPLVRVISKKGPRPLEMTVRVGMSQTDIAVRPQWLEWSVKLILKWDNDQFSMDDVANLVVRAGLQVGVGAGRPFSKNTAGMGWGTWELANEDS